VVDYYNRVGLLLPNAVIWSRLYNDPEYYNVAVDVDKNVMVSTIWEGFERPADGVGIYETAVVVDGQIIRRYRSRDEKDALEMHEQVCLSIFKRSARPEDGYVKMIAEAEAERRASQESKS
jgi:hypothetical protein